MLLIISCPFQKSLENLFLVKVRCLEFEKYGLCAFYKQLLLFHYSYMDLFIYLFMLYLFCGNKVELQWGNITGFVSSGPFTRPAMKYPSYIHEYLHDYLSFSKYLQIPPSWLNSPTFLLDIPDVVRSGSFTPHLDLLSNFVVSVLIFPVIGTCPNRWSLIIAFLNMGEFSSFTKAIQLELR